MFFVGEVTKERKKKGGGGGAFRPTSLFPLFSCCCPLLFFFAESSIKKTFSPFSNTGTSAPREIGGASPTAVSKQLPSLSRSSLRSEPERAESEGASGTSSSK